MNHTSKILPCVFCLFAILTPASVLAQAPDPNDIKTGSVLFFNRYTSDAGNPAAEDTQINLTNTSQSSSVQVHLFAVDGSSCGVADSFISLTPNQTAQFFASDFDPGIKGYLVAVAFAGFTPRQFNFLTGTAYIKQADGKTADLPAVAVQKINGGLADNGNGTVNLNFDSVNYGRLPGTVAVSTFNSQVTDQTCVYLYSPRNLVIGEAPTINVFALVYNELEAAGSTSFAIGCYTEVKLRNLRVINTITGFIPAGSTGWLKMSAGRPLLGASLSTGPRFSGGRNLTCLTLFTNWSITVPGGA